MIYLLAHDFLGTLPDWFMVVVTGVTAFYLYKTLKSQREVQRTQNELFKIENIRFKESIKPILKYTVCSDKLMTEDNNKKILTIEVTNETNSIALKISRIVETNDQTTQLFVVTGLSDKRNHLVKGDIPILFHFAIDPENRASGWITFSLHYQDVAGTKYKQGIICICDEFGIEINPFLPEVLTS